MDSHERANVSISKACVMMDHCSKRSGQELFEHLLCVCLIVHSISKALGSLPEFQDKGKPDTDPTLSPEQVYELPCPLSEMGMQKKFKKTDRKFERSDSMCNFEKV